MGGQGAQWERTIPSDRRSSHRARATPEGPRDCGLYRVPRFPRIQERHLSSVVAACPARGTCRRHLWFWRREWNPILVGEEFLERRLGRERLVQDLEWRQCL